MKIFGYGPAVLRLALGAVFAALALAAAVAVLEFGGGLLLLPGILTRWVSALLAIEMAVAASSSTSSMGSS